MVGFIPLLDRRLNILIKSGTAANVVPKPAATPMISDRWKPGTSRLDVSRIAQPSQPQSVITPANRNPHVILPMHFLSGMVTPLRGLRAAGISDRVPSAIHN